MRALSILTLWVVAGLTITTCSGENKIHIVAKYVNIESGEVKGFRADDGDYMAFLGIPYAAPPTGNNRFKDPKPPLPWKRTLEAKRTVICPQRGLGDEDCLILNVFTPVTIDKPLPVLFYIHGGSFLLDSGPTKGLEPLIKQDIIVVTINYRLGALGFLCLGTEEVPGNAGLKDQVMALQWVQKNIGKFGGDPNEVTVYGLSAGAAATEILIMANYGKVLFNRAILESGTATAVWAVDPMPVLTATNVASLLGHKTTKVVNYTELARFYRNVPADDLSKANDNYYDFLTDGTSGFAPSIERKLKNVKAMLTEAPYDLLVNGKFTKVPLMVVFATMEGLYLRSSEFTHRGYPERMIHNFSSFLPADLGFINAEDKARIAQSLFSFYFGNSKIDNIIDYLNYFGDELVMAKLLNSTEMHARGGNPVYLMEFGYKGNLGRYNPLFEDEIDVAGHGDFIKHAILVRNISDSCFGDYMTVRRVSKLIGNFVKYGNPTPVNDQVLPVPWPTVKPGNLTYLALDKQFEIRERPIWKRRLYWDELYAHRRRNLKPVGSECLCGCITCSDIFICNKGKLGIIEARNKYTIC